MKRLKASLFALVLVGAAAGGASAQWVNGGQPVLDMHRLYQIVGYLYNLDPEPVGGDCDRRVQRQS